MPIAVVQSAQSGGAANASSISLAAATAGDTLVSVFSQSASAVQPTCSGFTVQAVPGVYSAGADTAWIATKIAAGGETSIAWTATGTGRGVCFWEVSGAASTVTLDGAVSHTDNLSANTGGIAVTTSVPGSIILIGVGQNASSGTVGAWSGTNVATGISTAASRCFGGSFITTTPVSSTFTANWATSHVAAMIAIALQPPTVVSGSITFITSKPPWRP